MDTIKRLADTSRVGDEFILQREEVSLQELIGLKVAIDNELDRRGLRGRDDDDD